MKFCQKPLCSILRNSVGNQGKAKNCLLFSQHANLPGKECSSNIKEVSFSAWRTDLPNHDLNTKSAGSSGPLGP